MRQLITFALRQRLFVAGGVLTLVVRGTSRHRGPAAQAALLYDETPESVAAREREELLEQATQLTGALGRTALSLGSRERIRYATDVREHALAALTQLGKKIGLPSFNKEPLLTKVLCVVEPERFLPVLKYNFGEWDIEGGARLSGAVRVPTWLKITAALWAAVFLCPTAR